jgi:hypothetical protein
VIGTRKDYHHRKKSGMMNQRENWKKSVAPVFSKKPA